MADRPPRSRRLQLFVIALLVVTAGVALLRWLPERSSAPDPDLVALMELGFADVTFIASPDQAQLLTERTAALGTAPTVVARWSRTSDDAEVAVTGEWETAVTPDGHVVWRFHDLDAASEREELVGALETVTAAPGPVTLIADPTGVIDEAWRLCDRDGACLEAAPRAQAAPEELDLPLIAGASVNAWELVAGRTSPWQPQATGGLLDPVLATPRRIATVRWPAIGDVEVGCIVSSVQTDDGRMSRSGGAIEAALLCTGPDGQPVLAGPLTDPGVGVRLDGLIGVSGTG